MITVGEYRRKVQVKRRKLRNWFFVCLVFVLSVLVATLFGYFMRGDEVDITHNIVAKSNEIVVSLTELDTTFATFEYVMDKISELSHRMGYTNQLVKVFLGGKLVACYSLVSPELSVLNGKGEKDLAMNTSIKLIESGFRVRNYGNYVSNVNTSLILNRTPNKEFVERVARTLGIDRVSNFIFDKSLEGNLGGVIVILGEDFELSDLKIERH